MRAFAQYVMRGRRQAIVIVLLCGFFPMLYFISAAVVALVTLRRGWYEGFLILLWSLLPALLLWRMGDTTPLFLMTGTAVLALVLRHTNGWQQVLVAAVGLGVLTQLSLNLQPGYVEQLENMVSTSMAQQDGEVQYTGDQLVQLLLRFYGAWHALSMILCTMLGRWWQALLYNPGGFQQEFHALHFDTRIMLLLLALILGGLMNVPPLDNWLVIVSIPPMIAGLAVLHGVIALKKMGAQWLVLGYVTLVLMSPAIIALGLADSVFDFRKRAISSSE